jgi:septal ring factor EnvC (AmiA/AmiB activator)
MERVACFCGPCIMEKPCQRSTLMAAFGQVADIIVEENDEMKKELAKTRTELQSVREQLSATQHELQSVREQLMATQHGHTSEALERTRRQIAARDHTIAYLRRELKEKDALVGTPAKRPAPART